MKIKIDSNDSGSIELIKDMGDECIDDVIENMIIPMLVSLGYTQSAINRWAKEYADKTKEEN